MLSFEAEVDDWNSKFGLFHSVFDLHDEPIIVNVESGPNVFNVFRSDAERVRFVRTLVRK